MLDALLGHADDKSHAGEDMSGRKRPRGGTRTEACRRFSGYALCKNYVAYRP